MKRNSLRLTGFEGDAFVTYPTDDEDNPLLIRIERVSLDGQVTLTFSGPGHSVYRERIYQRGGMRKDGQR